MFDREKTSRIEIVRQAAEEDCARLCEGMMPQCAYEVIANKKLQPYVFAAALPNLVEHGRRNIRNIIIIGSANCGKTF